MTAPQGFFSVGVSDVLWWELARRVYLRGMMGWVLKFSNLWFTNSDLMASSPGRFCQVFLDAEMLSKVPKTEVHPTNSNPNLSSWNVLFVSLCHLLMSLGSYQNWWLLGRTRYPWHEQSCAQLSGDNLAGLNFGELLETKSCLVKAHSNVTLRALSAHRFHQKDSNSIVMWRRRSIWNCVCKLETKIARRIIKHT